MADEERPLRTVKINYFEKEAEKFLSKLDNIMAQVEEEYKNKPETAEQKQEIANKRFLSEQTTPADVVDHYTEEDNQEKLNLFNSLDDKGKGFYARLFEMQSDIDSLGGSQGNVNNISTDIAKKENGELGLVIKMKIGNSTVPTGIVISYGKLSFPDIANMTPEMFKEIRNFLKMRGITEFELPDNLDENLKKNFENTNEEARQPKTTDADRIDQENQDLEHDESTPLVKDEKGEPKEFDMDAFENHVEYFIAVRMNKHKNLNYKAKFFGRGFDVYKDAMKDDKGNENAPIASFRFKKGKKGQGPIVTFACVDDKLPEDYYDVLFENFRMQGFTHVKLGDNLTDEDKKQIRLAAGRQGVTIEGIMVNRHHAKKMIEAAEGKLLEKQLLDWKERFANQLEREALNQRGPNPKEPKNPYWADNNTTIKRLRSTVRIHKFKDVYDDEIITKMINPAADAKDSVQIIGALSSAAIVWDAVCYNRTIADLLKANEESREDYNEDIAASRKEFLNKYGRELEEGKSYAKEMNDYYAKHSSVSEFDILKAKLEAFGPNTCIGDLDYKQQTELTQMLRRREEILGERDIYKNLDKYKNVPQMTEDRIYTTQIQLASDRLDRAISNSRRESTIKEIDNQRINTGKYFGEVPPSRPKDKTDKYMEDSYNGEGDNYTDEERDFKESGKPKEPKKPKAPSGQKPVIPPSKQR